MRYVLCIVLSIIFRVVVFGCALCCFFRGCLYLMLIPLTIFMLFIYVSNKPPCCCREAGLWTAVTSIYGVALCIPDHSQRHYVLSTLKAVTR